MTGADSTKINGRTGVGNSDQRVPRIRIVALLATMIVSSGLGVVTFFALNSAYGAFLGSTTISTTDGVFTDWGTTGSPVSGSANIADLSDDKAPQPQLNLERFWVGFSTADGTAPTTDNLVENFYFRVDTADTDGSIDSNFNIQLNLGAGDAGTADHLIQLRAGEDGVDNPEVEIVLFEYDLPYPNIGAFTTGAITAKVANVTFTGAVLDTNATGAIHKHDATKYGFEVKIPISWFSSAAPDYGGQFEADGSGANSVVTSIFTSTGSLGSVGTPKDVINDADGNTVATVTLTATGGTNTVSLIVTKIGFTTSTQSIVAGSASTVITAQTQDEIGSRAVDSDTSIKYSSDSAFGSFSATANGTYTTTLTVTQSADTKTTSVFYKDTVSGTPTITAAEDPANNPDWTNATQAQTITPGPLTSVSHTPATSGAETVEDQTFVFTTTNPVPIDGKIIVTFPDGYTVSSGSATILVSENFSGTASVTNISGQAVTITRAGGSILSAGSGVTLVFNNVKNPVAATITGTYLIKTIISGGATIDQFTGVRSIPSFVTNISSAPVANLGFPRSATASISQTLLMGFPRAATANVSSGLQSSLTLTRGATTSTTSNVAPNFPRSSGVSLGDSHDLKPGKAVTSSATLTDTSKMAVGGKPSTTIDSGSAAQKITKFGRASTASLGDTNVLGFPRAATASVSSAVRGAVGSSPAATLNSGSALQIGATFPRGATASISDTFQPKFPRNATANISDTFAPSFPRAATANISDAVVPTFLRAATANISTTFAPNFPRTSAATLGSSATTDHVQVGVQNSTDTVSLGDSSRLGFPRAATANVSDTFVPKFLRSATASISDTFSPTFGRSATATISDTFEPSFPRAATATISDAFLPKFLRSATATISNTFAPSFGRSAMANISSSVLPKFPRSATATITDKFEPKFPRAATANISDTFEPSFPRAATANISDTFVPSFPRAATANISDSVLPKFLRAATAKISASFVPKFPRNATANVSDAFAPSFPRAATANISDKLAPIFPRSSTATMGDSHSLSVVSIGALTGTNVQPESLVAGAVGNVDVTFTLVNALPADGKIVITLPTGFTISSGSATAIGLAGTSFDGTETVSIVGQVITITRSGGGSLTAGTNITIELTNIKNPTTAGSTGTYAIKTTNAGGTTIDQDNAVAADTITGAAGKAKTAPNADISVSHAGAVSQLLVGQNQTHIFTVNHNGVDNASTVTFSSTLPSQVSLVSVASSQGSCSGTATITCNLGPMGATQSATVTIIVKIVSEGTLVFIGKASSNLNDTVPTNNTVSVTTQAVPPLTAAITYEPDRDVRAGETVVIKVTFNRSVTGTPTIAIDTSGIDLAAVTLTSSADGKVWTYSYKVPEGSDGQATVTISGVSSQSGGANVETANGTFKIDSTGAMVALTYEPKGSVSAGETLIITATFDRAITGTPTISIDTKGADLSPVAMTKTGDGKVWTYRYTVPANSDGEATVTIAGGTDQAGNPNNPATNDKFTIGPVKVGVRLSYEPVNNIVPGSTLVITATFDRSFTGTPSIGIDTLGPDVSGLQMTPTSDPLVWIFTYVVPEGSEGLATVTVSGPPGTSKSLTFTVANNSFFITGATTDLSIGVTASADSAVRRGNLTYTITVVNRGPAIATGVTLVNELPGAVNVDSIAPDSLNCNVVSGSVTCAFGTLAPDEAVVVLIDITVAEDAEGILINRSSVSGSEVDPDAANNVDTVETPVIVGVLSYVVTISGGDIDNTGITLTDSPDPVFLGNELTYDLDVTNSGSETVTNVNLIVSLPSSVTFLSAVVDLSAGSSSARFRPSGQPGAAPKIASLLSNAVTATDSGVGECTESSGTVICVLGELLPGQVARVTIIVEPRAPGILNNQATLVKEGQDP
ncbi:MAG: hypothetical protein IH872_04515 [Chloroflexi bacterium]|nr:hypothetical protein [Chloroflexota bacterium]